uniref:Uncharacterized protein n=1 Tax=viral metagenome TaxID=1070528 RepID=A0A6H1ZN19_9ZZZZ
MAQLKVQVKEKAGKITTKGRRALGSDDFALPPGLEEKRRGIKGRFPIDTKARARNALARAGQRDHVGITASEAATVRRRVKAKYPEIEVSKQ